MLEGTFKEREKERKRPQTAVLKPLHHCHRSQKQEQQGLLLSGTHWGFTAKNETSANFLIFFFSLMTIWSLERPEEAMRGAAPPYRIPVRNPVIG